MGQPIHLERQRGILEFRQKKFEFQNSSPKLKRENALLRAASLERKTLLPTDRQRGPGQITSLGLIESGLIAWTIGALLDLVALFVGKLGTVAKLLISGGALSLAFGLYLTAHWPVWAAIAAGIAAFFIAGLIMKLFIKMLTRGQEQ